MSFVPKEATTASPIQSQVNSFGTRFIREMARGGVDNFFVSPFGAYTVMAMLGAGARGDTAQEIDSVLGREALGYEDFMAELGRETKTDWDLGELKVSNQGWHKPGESLANNFRDRLSLLNTAIESLDFSDRDRAAQVMNDWASDATEGRIPQIITPDAIDPEVLVIVLANALLFNGKWLQPFDREKTRARDFQLPSGEFVPVQMMYRKGYFPVFTGPGYRAIELSTEGGAWLTVVVPTGANTLDDLVANLDVNAVLAAQKSNADFDEYKLFFPKWRQTGSYDLIPILQQLGIRTLFQAPDPDADPEVGADLSEMTGARDLHVSRFKQDTLLEIDEEKIEAAAVSHVGVACLGSAPEPAKFSVDRPFLGLLFNNNGLLIGAAKVNDPRTG